MSAAVRGTILLFAAALCLAPTWSAGDQANGDRPITFSEHIAPIVYGHCTVCHRNGGSSFSLQTYDQVRSRARLIAEATRTGLMPPWRAEPGVGDFVGTRRLTRAQIVAFQRWIADGAPEGDRAHAPLPPRYPSSWQLGEPDLVLELQGAFTLRPDGPDVYRNFVVALPVSGTRYVKAWEFLPGSAAVHHATLHVDATGASRRFDEEDPQPGYEGLVAPSARTPDGFFLDWAPGHTPFVLPEGIAWVVREGSDLVMMLHLRPTGKHEQVNPRIGLYLTATPPTHRPVMIRLTRQDFAIPPGEPSFLVTQQYRVPVGVDAYTVQPHAHNLAREVAAWAVLPDGRLEALIRIPDWQFEWQDVFVYRRPVFLPAGSVIHMEWRYDNSAANVRNPNNPPRAVTYGQRTSDEMSELWLQVVTRSPADRDRLGRDVRDHVLPQEIAGYETLVRARPDELSLRNDLALLYAETDNLEAAARHFGAAVDLTPQSAAAHHNLGTALMALGRREEAATRFERAVALDPGHSRAQRNLGTIRHAQGRLEEALRHYQFAERADPYDADLQYNLGVVLHALGRTTHAVPHYREALRLRAEWPKALLGLAWALASGADAPAHGQEAVGLAEEAVALLATPDPLALDVLAAAYAATGDFDRAISTAESAIAGALEKPDRELADAIRERLDYYRRRQSAGR